jgi:hypothetical protein
LQDALAALYPDRQEDFFERISAELGINIDSAKGSYYGFLREGIKRPLPKSHRDAYVRAGISPEVVDAAIPDWKTPSARTLQMEIEAKVRELTHGLEAARRANRALHRRVFALERAEQARRGAPLSASRLAVRAEDIESRASESDEPSLT